ncbi:hypothetical protein WG66_004985 [Moniliophthora roreri]|nr:hypothetical protein WG66_004985 [Moniliophthora roreri]
MVVAAARKDLGCFHCWRNYPMGCERHRFAPLGYRYDHSITSDGDVHQTTEGLTHDWNWQPHPDDIRSLSQENVANDFRSASWPLLYTFNTLESGTGQYEVSVVVDDEALVRAGACPAGTSEGSSSCLRSMQPDLEPSSPASRFRLQVGRPAATQASKMLRKKKPLYFCPFSGCTSSGFTEKHNLEYHCKAHRGIKPHVCEKCNKGFGSKGDLRRHQRAKTLPCSGRSAPSTAVKSSV